MARIFRGSPTIKDAPASTQVTFAPSDLPAIGGLSVVGIAIGMDGTEGGELGIANNLTRVRVKGNQRTYVDTTGLHVAQLVHNLGKGLNAGGVDPTTRTWLYVPLNVFDQENEDEADICGMPPSELPTLELTIGAAVTTSPKIGVGLLLSNIPTQFRPSIRSFPGGVPSSSIGFPVRFADSGLLRAFAIENQNADNNSLAGLRLYANGLLKFATGYGISLQGGRVSERVMRALQGGTNGGLQTTLTPEWIKLAGMVPVTESSSSYFEVDTCSTWNSANEFGLWSLIPVGAGA